MWTYNYTNSDELYHHGIKGQKWYEKNGPPYPLGSGSGSSRSAVEKRKTGSSISASGKIKKSGSDTKVIKSSSSKSKNDNSDDKKLTDEQKSKIKKAVAVGAGAAVAAGTAYVAYKYNTDPIFNEKVNTLATNITGKQYVDSCLEEGTTLNRIQTSENFENFAFYSTYTKDDSDKYMGLFGKNLTDRAQAAARQAEKVASKTGEETDIALAKELREKADSTKVYQLALDTTKKLRIPSDKNASDITIDLMKDSTFKKNLIESIEDSKSKMKRPSQQILFNQALDAVNKDSNKLTSSEKTAIYKAFNLSLTNHNDAEVAAQSTFYSALKKKGYGALLDYNDKEYSSYHAKRPVIVFDTDSVKLQSVTETNPKVVDKLYTKYNAERIAKETSKNTIGLVTQYSSAKLGQVLSFVNGKYDDYLGVKNSTTSWSNSSAVKAYQKAHPNTSMSAKEIYEMLYHS